MREKAVNERGEIPQKLGRLYPYAPGTAGPKEADHLLLRENHSWIAAETWE